MRQHFNTCRFLGGLVTSVCVVATSPIFAQTVGGATWQGAPRWQLGVQVQNTTTGVLLTSVQQNSAAAKSGLVAGDRILAVGGHQVGYVDGQLTDLGDEINAHITPSGQITALILTSRGALQTGSITLASSAAVLEGTALFQGGERPSSQAIIDVRLLDVSHAHWNAVVVAQWNVQGASVSPMPFRLSYNPQQVIRGHKYAIEAEITDRGRSLYRTKAPSIIVPGAGPITLTLAPITAVARPVPYDQVNQWYQQYLGRLPTQQEMYAWENQINRGQPATTIQSYLLGSTEYYNRYENNADQYLAAVHRSLYGAEPTPQQMQQLRQVYNKNNGIRTDFVQQVMQSPQSF
jgi:putative lipoprotein